MGGGKTWASLIDNLQGVHDKHYFSVFFRTTNTEIDKGLWVEAKDLYEPILFDSKGKAVGKSHISEQNKTITFPSGSRTTFAYLEYDKHADSWYGSEICKIYFEEFQFRTYYQFDVLRSRNRSKANVKCGIRCTLNPDPTHFVYDYVERFLDDEYLARRDLSGKRAYFVIISDVLYTSWDRQELIDTHGKSPQTYTYIPATIEDNDYLDEAYKDKLDSMSEKKRKQLLLGCWEPTEDSGMYFQSSYYRKATHVPLGSVTCRGWDTAGTAPEEGQTINRRADWTVGVRVSKSKDGNYYIHGMERFQDRAGPRDRRILQVGHRDGRDCKIVMGIDAGASGKFQFEEFAKKVSEDGLICHKDPMPVNKSKITRAEPYAVAAQNGFVYIVESSFSPEGLKAFYREHELFDGERSSTGKWDDVVDATASAFNYLCQARNYKFTKRSQAKIKTLANDHLTNNEVPRRG